MGSGGVAIAALPTVICLKVPFSDGLGGGKALVHFLHQGHKSVLCKKCAIVCLYFYHYNYLLLDNLSLKNSPPDVAYIDLFVRNIYSKALRPVLSKTPFI